MIRGASKDMRKLIKELKPEGWTAELTRGDHIALVHPRYGKVFCSQTPSDRRALQNIRQEIRAAQRRHNCSKNESC